MPEMLFRIRWPDGASETCYSPSLVVRDHLVVGQSYPVPDFVARTRVALTIASDRVEAKYGHACSRAMGQLSRIAERASSFADQADGHVTVLSFDPS